MLPFLDLELDLLFCLEQRCDPALEDLVSDGSRLYAFLEEERVTGRLSGNPGQRRQWKQHGLKAGWYWNCETLLVSQKRSPGRCWRQINFLKVAFTVAVNTEISEGTAGCVRQRTPITGMQRPFSEDGLDSHTGRARGERSDFVQLAGTRSGAVVRNTVNTGGNRSTTPEQKRRFSVALRRNQGHRDP